MAPFQTAAKPVLTPAEASAWTYPGVCPYPQFIFYHFTTPAMARRIRSSGFAEARGGGGLIWLSRWADDLARIQNPIRLVVALVCTHLLVPMPGERLEDAYLALGRLGNEPLADFLDRNRFCAVWDSDPQHPWVGVVEPQRCRVVEGHYVPGVPVVTQAIGHHGPR